MIKHTIKFRVRYAEVDRMGYVHHGNYAAYFEMGRTELMRNAGMSYKEMEDNGVIMPLSEFTVKYFKPALYDDELVLETRMHDPKGAKLVFEYSIFNAKKELLVEGKIPLVFVDAKSRRPIRPPKDIVELINSAIHEKL